MTGPELAKRLTELKVPAKILFISGFTPGNLPIGLGEITSEMLLEKPFAAAELLRRVGQLVES
jgi:FixJ family two-component response regulator